jgi:phosphate/sulfate permease
MNKQTIEVIVRALLQAIAGALTARGIAIENSATEAIIGGIIALGTVVWSIKSKKAAADK